MFFEGSEKKVELIATPSTTSLRALGHDFWRKLVHAANAEVLSHIGNSSLDAYLLSESSLFVWDDRLVMITCGQSSLIKAVLKIINALGADAVAFISYQRKNECISQQQSSSFEQDVALLRQQIPGKAYRVGHLDSHHHYLYLSDTPYQAASDDTTLELLMYHIQGNVADYLVSGEQTRQGIRERLAFHKLLADFTLDDHVFNPFGYSINGICEDKYFTVHITPQESSSYVSFETNIRTTALLEPIVTQLLHVLNPSSWDLIGFNEQQHLAQFPLHLCLGSCSIVSEQGYKIQFRHYQQLRHEVLVPEPL